MKIDMHTFVVDSKYCLTTLIPDLSSRLLEMDPIKIGQWHAVDVSRSSAHDTFEITDVSVILAAGLTIEDYQNRLIGLNEEWADEHFAERVGGQPVNPAPSHIRWPWAHNNATHQDAEQKFSHTYPERMWPKRAGMAKEWQNIKSGLGQSLIDRRGIRFKYGDLNDVVNLLIRHPMTRQAYLPIWFPEDTGSVEKQRVPCTLGYHFMMREGKLSCRYYIRSCDLVRHFSDDLYMAVRLQHWICNEINEDDNGWSHVDPGQMSMHIGSLHALRGDERRLKGWANGED